MRIFKKSVAVLLAVLMLLSMGAVMAFAEDGEEAPVTEEPLVIESAVVAGVSALCTSNWDAADEANAMTLTDGVYTKTFENVPAGNDYQFKVVVNGTMWCGNGEANYSFNVTDACDVTITFNPETLTAEIKGEIPTTLSIDYVIAVGNGDGNWLNDVTWDPSAEANKMTEISEGVYQIVYNNVPADGTNYEVKFAANAADKNDWSKNWGTSDTEGVCKWDGGNIKFVLEADSNVTLTLDLTNFDFATKEGATYSCVIEPVSAASETETVETVTDTEPVETESETEPVETESETEPVETESETETEPFVVESAMVCGSPNLCGEGTTGYGWDTTDTANAMELVDGLYVKTYEAVAAADGYQFKIVANGEKWIGVDGGDSNFTFNVTEACDVTITFNPETYAVAILGDSVVIPQEMAIDFIAVVGNGDGTWLNDASWDPAAEANKMESYNPGLYSITFENVKADTGYEFKFAANGAWTYNWGYGEDGAAVFDGQTNIKFDVESSTGYATVQIFFDITEMDLKTGEGAKYELKIVDSGEVPSETETVTEGEPFEAGWYAVGDATLFGTSWADDKPLAQNKMTKNAEGVWEVTIKNVAAGEYFFKVAEFKASGKASVWHPDGMGNDSTVTVAEDGSTVIIKLVPQASNSDDAPYAEVYAPGQEPTETTPTETETETQAPSETETQAPAKKTTITAKNITLYVQATATIKASIKNAVGTTTYKSSKTSVAKVDKNGKITAKKAGKTTVTITNNGVSKKITVTVKNPSLKKKSGTVKVGKTVTIKVNGSGKFTFKSANKKIATVTKKGVVKGIKKGTTKITVKANGKKLTFKVTVKKK